MSVTSLKNCLPGRAILSGIQPTGVFHLGNLLGAINAWRDLSRSVTPDTPVVFMVADLHAITVPKSPESLAAMRWKALASIIASGIDPEKCILYFQSDVASHSRLAWLLSSVASLGYMQRMTQWKSKANLDETATLADAEDTPELNLALFSYPNLQAADILVHGAHYVPVGEDQSQHLELTRSIAKSFNHRFGSTFVVPTTVLTPHKKVLSLRNYKKKMSKSDPDPNSCVFVTDTFETIQKKLKRALTDSVQGPITFDPENRPAVANLLSVTAGSLGMEPEEYLLRFQPKDHKSLKDQAAEAIEESVRPIRTEYTKLMEDKSYLMSIAVQGSSRANERTQPILDLAMRNMGFR